MRHVISTRSLMLVLAGLLVLACGSSDESAATTGAGGVATGGNLADAGGAGGVGGAAAGAGQDASGGSGGGGAGAGGSGGGGLGAPADSGTHEDGPGDSGLAESGTQADGSTDGDSGLAESGTHADGSTEGGACVLLKVKNYEGRCSVNVAQELPLTMTNEQGNAAEQTQCVVPGMVKLRATAHATFKLGATAWHHTSGDTGSGEPGTIIANPQALESDAKVVVSTPTCVWVCCEAAAGGGCPSADQCP